MSNISVDYDVLNQKGSPAWFTDTFANIPTAGFVGRMFISKDTFAFYRDTGTGWDLIGGPGSGTITGSGVSGQVSFFSGTQVLAGSNNLLWDNTNSRLGINVASPTVTLEISGSVKATALIKSGGTSAQILLADGTTTPTSTFQAAITLTTTGTTGVSTLSAGVLNVPTYTFVSSVNAITLGTSGTDLTSTVANSTTTPTITLNVPTASATNRGALSSADFSTFNNKQATITLTTTGTSGAATFSANTLNVPNYGSALSGYLPLTGGTLTGALSGTSATFSGLITSTAASDILTATSSNTSYKWINLGNTGGNLVVGINTSAGGGTMTTAAYASYIFTRNATDLVFGTNEVARLTIASTGGATFSSTLQATKGSFIASSGTALDIAGNAIFRGDTGVATPRQLIITSGGSTPVYLEAKGYAANYQTDFGIRTFNSVGTSFEVFYADSSGRVGINQVSPSYQLDVNGTTKATNYATITNQATIPSLTTATILTLNTSAVGVYIVQGNFGGQGNNAYGSTLIVVANLGSFRIVTNGSGSNSALSLSGANVQITNVLGISLDAYASAILIGN